MVGFLRKKDVIKQDIQETFKKNGFYVFAVTKENKLGVLSLGAFDSPETARETMFEKGQDICPKIRHFEVFSSDQAIKMVKKNKAPGIKKRRKNILAHDFLKKEDLVLTMDNQVQWTQSKNIADSDPDIVGFAFIDAKDNNSLENTMIVRKNDIVRSFVDEGRVLYGDINTHKHTCGSLKKSPHVSVA